MGKLYLTNGKIYSIKTGKELNGWLHFGRCKIQPYVRTWDNRKCDRRKIFLHCLLWEIFNGPIPEGMTVDHINGNRLDNRLNNLRLLTPKEQLKNRRIKS